jgi:hypothetical protein
VQGTAVRIDKSPKQLKKEEEIENQACSCIEVKVIV